MSGYEHNPGKGSIFKNGYKERDGQPDMKGTFKTPDGKEWQISGWWNQTRGGDDYLNLSIQEPYNPNQRRDAAPPAPRATTGGQRGGGYGGQGRPGQGGSGGPSFEQKRKQMRETGEAARKAMGGSPAIDNLADDDIPF